MSKILSEVQHELDTNDGKISLGFIELQVDRGIVHHSQLTPNMRVCVITLPSGHEVIGVAQVLNEENDDEAIGQSVAKQNAINELWKVFGSMAKAIM